MGSWTRFVPLWRDSPDHFVSHLASLGRSWGGLGRLLGALGALLACYLTHLGALGRSAGALELSWGTLGALGGRSRTALGLFLDALGTLLGTLVPLSGRSEGALGRYGSLFGVLGFVLGPLGFMSMIFWIFLRGFFYVFWWLRFRLLTRGRGGLDTLPHASPFSSDACIPAHVGRLCLPPRWRLRRMLQAF